MELSEERGPSQSGSLLASGLWGFAEATLFFIVPDVLLSRLGLERPKTAFLACAAACLGALLGGSLTWAWGSADPDAARSVLLMLPGIHEPILSAVDSQLRHHGLIALLFGPLQGIPYKTLAAAAGEQGFGLGLFLAVSLPARALRFVAVTGLAVALAAGPLAKSSLERRRLFHALVWLAFYALYFPLMRQAGG